MIGRRVVWTVDSGQDDEDELLPRCQKAAAIQSADQIGSTAQAVGWFTDSYCTFCTAKRAAGWCVNWPQAQVQDLSTICETCIN